MRGIGDLKEVLSGLKTAQLTTDAFRQLMSDKVNRLQMMLGETPKHVLTPTVWQAIEELQGNAPETPVSGEALKTELLGHLTDSTGRLYNRMEREVGQRISKLEVQIQDQFTDTLCHTATTTQLKIAVMET